MTTRPDDRPGRRADGGFTLIELLVVVVIIGVLAAIAIPIFLSQKEKAAEAGVKSDLKSVSVYLESYFVDEGTYAGVTEEYALDEGFRRSVGTVEFDIDADGSGYCLSGSHGGRTFYLDSDLGAVTTEGCNA
jgi:type IV pilus assembly protein PilA